MPNSSRFARSMTLDIGLLVAEDMNIAALLQWRAVCQGSKLHVSLALTHRLRRMVREFTPVPGELLALVTRHSGLIGGVFALSFLLQAPLLPATMDIYVSDEMFHQIVDGFNTSATLSPTLTYHGIITSSPSYRRQREICRHASYATPTSRHIRIHECGTLSPCSAIVRTWTTGLMNFVTETYLGCAYPVLTFNRLALISDVTLFNLAPDERIVMDSLSKAGFSFASHAGNWDMYKSMLPTHVSLSVSAVNVFPCFREKYICPDQGRFFGDPGSLLFSFAPNIHDTARRTHPLRHMAIWRMCTSGYCHRGCAWSDDSLPRGILSLPTLLVDDVMFDYTSLPRLPVSPDPLSLELPRSNSRRRGRALTI